ncbi:hypothetical protein G3I76_15805 [Streptomyces sp. SID11233]|nr:hypothetical protein [Streptomyces sp. SID11233]
MGLITGDTVELSETADGTTVSAARSPDGKPAAYDSETTPDGDVYVYPDAALDGTASGTLDRELFNITGLVAAGYDDAHRPSIPVIVSYEDRRRVRARRHRGGGRAQSASWSRVPGPAPEPSRTARDVASPSSASRTRTAGAC